MIDRKYAIAGAQPGNAILKVLRTAYTAWKKDNTGLIQLTQGATYASDNNCTY